VAATTGAITELAAQLVVDRIDRVTVESTSDYWRIWYYLLESAGLSVQLVNARFALCLTAIPTRFVSRTASIPNTA